MNLKLATWNLKLLLLLLVLAVTPARAEPQPPGLQVTAEASGVRLRWSLDTHLEPAAQLVALEVRGDAPLTPRLARVVARAWNGRLPTGDGAAAGVSGRPAAPLEVLRSARARGRRIDVLRINPVWQAAGSAQLASSLDAFVPGAAPLDHASSALWTSSEAFGDAPGPGNPRARAVRITVDAGGFQQLTGQALAAAGFVLGGVDPRRLHLRSGGQQVPLELRGTADGSFDPGDTLRFWAPEAGDRWNRTTTYWLTAESGDGARMAQRNVAPGGAALRGAVYEPGRWRAPRVYDSRDAGPSNDHWFSAVLRAGAEPAEGLLDVPLAAGLPPADGATTLTVSGSAGADGPHTLAVRAGAVQLSASWSGRGPFFRSFELPHDASARLSIAGQPGDTLAVDAVDWLRPASLDAGGRGVSFQGVAGTWRYRLAGVPAGASLYDVTSPLAPELLLANPAATVDWQDGPAVRSYVLAGPGTLHTPQAAPYGPVDLATPLDADAVYIAPAGLHAALAPLLAQRQAQGYRAALVDTQAIYDGWSWGQVDPRAIRSFLRYAAATWRRAPQAVTLVGDGTSDPLNYGATNQVNWLPPYLATVDPWLGETACETCYAQLDGDDPLDDVLPDLMLGRLPAKSAAELQALVAKIVGYETAPADGFWRSRAVFVADDADAAGNFAALADDGVALLPPGVRPERIYYAPGASGDGREPHPGRAFERTVAALSTGPGLATFVGHSSYWQWASTDPAAQPPYLLGLYDPDSLPNRAQPSIVLEMTCLTAAFHTPAVSGTTIDERLLLSQGGAVAVWGPTGLGVAHGHDALQRGFHTALWRSPAMQARLGTLVNAGYLDLYRASTCCQDALRTFALLGDPLTPARVRPSPVRFLPGITRRAS